MKNIFKILIITTLFLSFSHLSFSKTKTNSSEIEQVYRIHIGAFVKAKLIDFNKIRQYGYIYAEKFDNNILQVYLGEYESDPAAKKVLAQIKNNGYPDAYVTRRSIKNGHENIYIQLGLGSQGEDINWKTYTRAGKLFTQISKQQIKILTGPFDSMSAAKKHLTTLKSNNFSDAFPKIINDRLVHAVTSFETGDLESVSVILADSSPKTEKTEQVSPAVETAKGVEKTTTRPKDIPKSYDTVVFTEKSPSSNIALPNIRKNVKRTSVIELQKVLKAANNYKYSLDGLYGKGTAKGYELAKGNIPQLKKYLLLSKYAGTATVAVEKNALQNSINTLLENPTAAMSVLEASSEPIAKAYRAYILFRQNGANMTTDNLMNAAIKSAFKQKKLNNAPKFDYNATYAYKDFGQLILHLRYIQAVASNEPAAPCWLFQNHPKEANKAFEPKAGVANTYRVENCDHFVGWEEINLLETIVTDLNPDPKNKANKKELEKASAKRTQLFLSPRALNNEEVKSIAVWNTTFWKGMNAWANKDDLHKKLAEPLKIAFLQSEIRLEDYFMDKGFSSKESKSLALQMMRTFVEPHLETYY